MILTQSSNTANLLTSLPHEVTGIQTPRKGHNRPQLQAAFLYPSKTQTHSMCGCLFIMVGCIEQLVKQLAGSFAGSLNLIHSTAQRVRPMGGGLLPLQRNTAMKHLSPVQTGQTHPTTKPEPRFKVFQHDVLIASNLNIYAAIGLKSVFSAATVKFATFAKAGV